MGSAGTETHNGDAIAVALKVVRDDYVLRNPKSSAQLAQAAKSMPGGNTRTVLYYDPFPLAMARGEGQHLFDVDGHRYVNFLGEYTAGIYGHTDPHIREAVQNALANGVNLSAHNTLESQLAAILCDRIPSWDMVRFTNSGTEANLVGIALAKAFTGRSKIMVFDGAYHGSVIAFAGGASPINVPHDYVVATYNDPQGARELIAQHKDDLAAVLIEPMLGASGCIPADKEFLQVLREETEKVGAVLIFDEVMTSRLSAGGRQALLGIMPDITTAGKYLGGGMSFGAVGGRADIMGLMDPGNPKGIPHPGTFNNNVITMAAGIAGLTKVYTADVAVALTKRGDRMRDGLNALAREKSVAVQFTGLGSLMNMHPAVEPVKTPQQALGCDGRLRDLFFFHLIEEGIYQARRGLVALMLPVQQEDIDHYLAASGRFFDRYGDLLKG